MTLRAAAPGEAGFRPDGLAEVDRVIEAAVAAQRLPRRRGRGGQGRRARAPASRSAGSPTTPMPRPVRRGHDLRPGQPHQGHRHHDHGHDPGGRGQARPRQAGVGVPARVPRRGQGQGHGVAPADALVGHRLVGAPLQGAQGQGGVPPAHRWPWTSSTSRARSRSTATWASSCSARSWSAWRDRTSTRSRARGIFEPLGMKDTRYRPGPELLPAHRAHRERSLARPRPARRGARRERVRPGRRRAARRPLRHRPRPGALRADAAERRRLRAAADRVARDRGALHQRRRRARLEPRARLGHAQRELLRGHRCSRRAPSATPASPARRCGSIPTASSSSSCSPTASTRRARTTRSARSRPAVADAVVRGSLSHEPSRAP